MSGATATPSYVSSAAAQAAGRVLAVGANLFSLLLVARILGTGEFGRYAFVMAYVSIACSLADLGTTSALGRGLANARTDSRELYLGNFCIVRGAITVAATLLAIAAAPLVKPDLAALLAVGSLAVPVVASRFFDPVFQVYGRPHYSIVSNLVYAVGLVTVSVAILVWLRMSLFAYLVGWAAVNLAYTATAVVLALRLVRPRFRLDRQAARSILTLAVPLGVGALFYIVHARADTMMLGYMRTADEVGLYNAAFKLLDFGAIAATTLLWPLLPVLSKALHDSPEHGRAVGRSVMEGVGVATVPVAVAAPFVADPAIRLLYGPDFAAAAQIVGTLGVAFVVLVFALAGAVLNISAGRVGHAYWNTALAVAVNVSLNLLLIPRLGFVGAAYATLASHLCMLAVQHYYVARNVGRLFAPGYWARIAALNFLLWSGFALGGAREHVVLVPVGLLAYAAIVWRLGLLPGARGTPRSTGEPASRQGRVQ
jgi:O-antigen/teichoic acid export membrane protein